MNKEEAKKKLKEITISSYEISLSGLIDKKIKEVAGYLCEEYGEPMFQMTRIIFEDDTYLDCEGEHDCPYLTSSGSTTPEKYNDDDYLEALYKANPDYEEEDDEN
jgi:hypothetical protein